MSRRGDSSSSSLSSSSTLSSHDSLSSSSASPSENVPSSLTLSSPLAQISGDERNMPSPPRVKGKDRHGRANRHRYRKHKEHVDRKSDHHRHRHYHHDPNPPAVNFDDENQIPLTTPHIATETMVVAIPPHAQSKDIDKPSKATKNVNVIALEKIQKFCRATMWRRKITKMIELDYQNRIDAYHLMEQLIDEYMVDEFMPELLIEVLGGEGFDYDHEEGPEKQIAHEILDIITGETFLESIRSVASLTIDSLLSEYFEETNTDKNPLNSLIDRFCDDEIRIVLREIVRETIDEDVKR